MLKGIFLSEFYPDIKIEIQWGVEEVGGVGQQNPLELHCTLFTQHPLNFKFQLQILI